MFAFHLNRLMEIKTFLFIHIFLNLKIPRHQTVVFTKFFLLDVDH